jgi:hypothetical protein
VLVRAGFGTGESTILPLKVEVLFRCRYRVAVDFAGSDGCFDSKRFGGNNKQALGFGDFARGDK